MKKDILTYKLDKAGDFIEVIDSNKRYYGGDQAWFKKAFEDKRDNIGQNGGCGTVAASNITAYLSGCSKYKGLYAYSDFSKENYIKHMKEMYNYVTPHHIGSRPLGVWPIRYLGSKVEKFAKDRGVDLKPVYRDSEFNYENTTDYIKCGLKSNSPVAMLIGINNKLVNIPWKTSDSDGYTSQSFKLHWVTVTELYINKTSPELSYVKVSSWGGYAEIYILNYINGERLYQGLLYFK
jgi:hypothetical protein